MKIYRFIISLIATIVFLTLVFPALAQNEEEIIPADWDGESRFTVLIAGLDRRPTEYKSLGYRTDAIIIASYDPETNQIGMMHIPRDLFFTLDNGQLVRVNTLLGIGNGRRNTYGPQFMADTLQLNLGMYIDAYLFFDFQAFEALIDAVGGITVDVPYGLVDSSFPSMNYGYDPLYIPSGEQQLNGYDALRYARTRHADNDYYRGERQLQVMKAFRDKLDSPIAIQQLMAKAPSLAVDLKDNIYTNLDLATMVELGLAIMQVPGQNIHTGSLNERYTIFWGGERVPDRVKMIDLMTELYGGNYAG